MQLIKQVQKLTMNGKTEYFKAQDWLFNKF